MKFRGFPRRLLVALLGWSSEAIAFIRARVRRLFP